MNKENVPCPLGRPHESRTSPRTNLHAHAIQIHDDAELLHRLAGAGEGAFRYQLKVLESRIAATLQMIAPPKL